MNSFKGLSENELMHIDGGMVVITGAMICAGLGCVAAGVAVGYGVGKVIKYFLIK